MKTNNDNIPAIAAILTSVATTDTTTITASIMEEFISSMDTSMAENEIARKGKVSARRKAAVKANNKKNRNNKLKKLAKQTNKFKHHGHKDHDVKFKGQVCQTPMANNSYKEKRWATWATGSSKESLSAYIIYQMT